jgi:hypothetical protein
MKFLGKYVKVARHLPASVKLTGFSDFVRVQSAGILLAK